MKAIFNHERYKLIGVGACIALLIWFYGCESKTSSLLSPDKNLTRAELQLELDTLLKSAELKYADLDRQDEIKSALLNNLLLVAQSGTVNPIGVITSLAVVMGIGATVDDVRTRKRVKKQLPSD